MGCGERVRSRALGQTIRGNRSVSQLLEISLIGIQVLWLYGGNLGFLT
jgi:hypothetical protein